MLTIDYNKFTDSELEEINEAAWAIQYIFDSYYVNREERIDLFANDQHYRSVNEMVSKTFITLARREQERSED